MPDQPIQTQLYLQAMRPHGQDADLPEFAEPQQTAATDPALSAWWAIEQAFDRDFADSLASVSPPAALQATILAGVRASRRASVWRRTAWKALATAAAITLLAGLSYLSLRPTPTLAEPLVHFRSEMIHTLENQHSLDHKTSKAEEVRVWLASHQGITDPTIPAGLSKRETIGCKVFEWHGTKVTLICFRPCPSGDPQSASAHLFVVDEQDAPDLLNAFESQSPAFAESNAWTSAVWREAGKIHVLVSRSALPHLQGLFAGG